MVRRQVLSSLLLFAVCTSCLWKEGVSSFPETETRKRNLRKGTRNRNENGNRKGDSHYNGNGNANGNANGNGDSNDPEQRSLIIGGNNAVDYPRSIVYLSDRVDDLSCGGSLISPTIVLAAGHCEISLVTDAVFLRYHHPAERDASTGLGIYSDREIRVPIEQEILHPDYDRNTLQNDVMLLVLEYSPNDINSIYKDTDNTSNNTDATTDFESIPYMKLHTPTDPTLDEISEILQSQTVVDATNSDLDGQTKNTLSSFPIFASSSGGNPPKTTNLQFKALGWGHIVDGKLGEPSETLQEVTLNYVQNGECEKARESDALAYEGRITADMMCTYASEKDTCHGDSGGPVVLPNPSPSEDEFPFVQVGIVSWGEDCADRVFPGVASRVASSYEWIRDRVCSIDGSSAPATFRCESEHTYSPAPSLSPTTENDGLEAQLRTEGLSMVDEALGAPKKKVKVAVEIFLDVFATETSWQIFETDTRIPVIVVPFETYRYENRVREEVELSVGEKYTFKIEDQYGDGITKLGSYRVYVIDKSKPDHIGEMLVNELGDFKIKRKHTFQIDAASVNDQPPSAATTADNAAIENTASTEETFEGRAEEEDRLPVLDQRYGILSDLP